MDSLILLLITVSQYLQRNVNIMSKKQSCWRSQFHWTSHWKRSLTSVTLVTGSINRSSATSRSIKVLWSHLSMDFIVTWPLSRNGDTIIVVVGRLTLGDKFYKWIIPLHGVPKVTCTRDPKSYHDLHHWCM
jgi:hypothetical protein